MDLSKLKQIAAQLKEDASKSSTVQGEWPNVVFLPAGNHKGRFIVDPDEELYIKYNSYGYFAKGIRDPEDYPEQLPEHFYNRLADVAKELSGTYLKFSRNKKKNFLVYFYLTETDKPDENWQPKNLYCLVADWRFEAAFSNMINSLVTDAPDKLLSSLRPDMPGPLMNINYVRDGQKSVCQISPLFSESPALVTLTDEERALPEDERKRAILEKMGKLGYKPLDISYIKPGFDQKRYDELLDQYEKELAEASAARAAKAAAQGGQATPEQPPQTAQDAPAPENVHQESQPAPQQEAVAEQPAQTPPSSNPFEKYKRQS